MTRSTLPIPSHFDRNRVGEVWKVDYQAIADSATAWTTRQALRPARHDRKRICLLLVDCQNTFCTPGFELFVAGRSGNAAVEDSVRIVEFIYHNLDIITQIDASLDTHAAMQIFHPLFLVDSDGNHPQPYTEISIADVEGGRWKVNPAAVNYIGRQTQEELQAYLLHYCRQLAAGGKYQLMIWPYHAMVGGIGHSLVSAIEEALFFHNVARQAQTRFEIKGNVPLTENYSVFGPEVTHDQTGKVVAEENQSFLKNVLEFDALIIAGQAKSHCVAWSVADFLNQIRERDPSLAGKVYLLEDCTSPVVVPGASDFTAQADEAFARFAAAGMHLVRSTDPIESWAGIDL
jgi:nicotinamidase-related amidase